MARPLIALGLAVTVSALLATVSEAAPMPNAFVRAGTPADRLPPAWRAWIPGPTDRAPHRSPDRAVRLIATEGQARLFAYRDRGIEIVLQDGSTQNTEEICIAVGAATFEGSDCEPEFNLCLTTACGGLGESPLEWYMTGDEVVLLAGNAVTRIDFALRSGSVASVQLPSDRGLIWRCGGGCGCIVKSITAYAGVQAFATDNLARRNGRPYWCV